MKDIIYWTSATFHPYEWLVVVISVATCMWLVWLGITKTLGVIDDVYMSWQYARLKKQYNSADEGESS